MRALHAADTRLSAAPRASPEGVEKKKLDFFLTCVDARLFVNFPLIPHATRPAEGQALSPGPGGAEAEAETRRSPVPDDGREIEGLTARTIDNMKARQLAVPFSWSPGNPASVPACLSDCPSWQVPYLRGELTKRGLLTRGSRDELGERLKQHLGF